MQINYIALKNFKSFGNKVTKINFQDFKPGLALLVGQNGCGKTTICQALEYVLYGSVKGLTLANLVNSVNKSDMMIETELIIENGEKMRISRGYAPSVLKLFINDEEIIGSSKDYIEKIIQVKLNNLSQLLFNNIFSINISSYKSFLNFSNTEKLQFLIKIFGLEEINDLHGLALENFKSIEASYKSSEMYLDKIKHQYTTVTEKLKSLVSNNSNNDTEIKNEVETIQKEILEIESKIEDLKTVSKNLEIELKTVLKSNVENLKSLKQDLEYQVKQKEDKVQKLVSGICPTCGSKISKESFKDMQDELDMLKNDLEKVSKEFEEYGTKFKNVRKELEDNINKIKSLRFEIQRKQDKISSLNNIQKERNDTILEQLREQRENAKKEFLENKEELEKIKSEIQIADIVKTTLSTNGAIEYIIKKYIPILYNYLTKFSILLSSDYEINITYDRGIKVTVLYNEKEMTIQSLSTGERKKIELIFILSFISTICLTSGRFSIIFIDELLNGLDMNNVNFVLDAFKKLAELEKMVITLVHHSQLDSNMFATILEVTKPKEFTELNIIDNTERN